VPKEVAEILTGMLESLPKNRLTPKKALALPYFTTPNASERLTSYLEEKRTRSLSKVLKLSN
jgi:serine/threonine protein kinase